MKSILRISLTAFVAAIALWSCKKDETMVTVAVNAKPTLSATATTLTLLQANAANPAVTFNWTSADLGYKAPLSYNLQLSKAGTNFAPASTTEIAMGSNKTKAFTVTDINKELLKIVAHSTTSTVEARVKVSAGTDSLVVYSNTLNLTVTPYKDIIIYNFPQALWIAGNFQGWSPSTAPKIVDKAATGNTSTNYEGYIDFNNASPEFKIVKGNDWSFGDFGASSPTTLTNGGSNLQLTQGAGVYLLRANTVNMTWSADKINTWGIIGAFNGWAASVPMTYNAATGEWTITQNMPVGEFKFRANNDWAINFGDGSASVPADGRPDYGGDNLKITTAGNYTITLDIGVAGNYSYTIKKN
jgi:hypothetical protein